jgi:hypothetical protein
LLGLLEGEGGLGGWSSTALNLVWVTEDWFNSLELGVGMQKWGLTALNWVWGCRGGTGCKHAEAGFDSFELGLTALNWVGEP